MSDVIIVQIKSSMTLPLLTLEFVSGLNIEVAMTDVFCIKTFYYFLVTTVQSWCDPHFRGVNGRKIERRILQDKRKLTISLERSQWAGDG